MSTDQPIERDRAWACLAMNLGVTPGFGSIMAGRRVVGALTAAVAFMGVIILMAGMIAAFRAMFDGLEPMEAVRAHGRRMAIGLGSFLLAWVVSGIDSLMILRRSVKRPALPPIVPTHLR